MYFLENSLLTTSIVILIFIIIIILAGYLLDTRQEMLERQNDINATVSWGRSISYPKIKVRKVKFFKRLETEVALSVKDTLTIGESTSTVSKAGNDEDKFHTPIPAGKITIEETVYDAYHEKIGELRKTVTLAPGDKIQVLRDNISIIRGAENETIRRIVYARAQGESSFKSAPGY